MHFGFVRVFVFISYLNDAFNDFDQSIIEELDNNMEFTNLKLKVCWSYTKQFECTMWFYTKDLYTLER